MTAFRALLLVMWACIAVYTAIVVANLGFGLFPIFLVSLSRTARVRNFLLRTRHH